MERSAYKHLKGTVHDPPEDDRKYGPKHVEATSLKFF